MTITKEITTKAIIERIKILERTMKEIRDDIETEDDRKAYQQYLKEKKEGKLTSLEELKKELGLSK